MSGIVIVGGGFAGVWGAAAAARVRGAADVSITLVTPGDDLVLRPRLYEAEPERATIALKRILAPIGVEHVRDTVARLDAAGHRVVTGDGATLRYDRLVLAAGSGVVRPGLPGAAHLSDVDTLDGAARLAARLRGLPTFTAVVVGAGFTGLEIATELAGRGRVILVERADAVGPELGPGPRPEIEAALNRLGVEVRLGTTLASLGPDHAILSDGTRIATDAVVWTAGMRANRLTEDLAARRDGLGRLAVDGYLRVDGDVFAAGDVAAGRVDADHPTMQSCQHASPMGKTAGHNAAADLLGRPLIEFTPAPYVTDLDLGAAGAVFTRGWDRRVVSAGTEGKRMKRWLMRVIAPPVDDAARILAASTRVYTPIPDVAPE